MSTPRIDIPKEQLAKLCKRWNIVELSLFGSVLRDDFGPDSDVDIMVKFAANSHTSLLDLVTIQNQIEQLVGRRIDLVTRSGIEHGSNPYIKNKILKNAETFYAA